MGIVELAGLELQVEHLLKTLEDLKAENHYLRHQMARFAREKSLTAHNNRLLAGKVRKIISQLQEQIT